jgi:hypothetical protein
MIDEGLQLSETERQRIRAEEIFRAEVQKELQGPESPPSPASKVIAAFNRPLGLWFLSSVVLGLLGWAYATWEEDRAAKAQTRAEIIRLDIEIYGRVRQSAQRLEAATNAVGLRESIGMLDEGSGIFAELENRSFEGMLLALLWLVPDEEKGELENAREAWEKLQTFRNVSASEAAAAIEQVKRDYMNGSFAIRQWRN